MASATSGVDQLPTFLPTTSLVQGAVGLVAGFLLLQVARRIHLEEKVNV